MFTQNFTLPIDSIEVYWGAFFWSTISASELKLETIGNKKRLSKWCLQSPVCAAWFTAAKARKQPECLTMNDWVKEIMYIYTYAMEYCFVMRKKETFTWDNMDGSLGHAKWVESDRERQRLCDIISIKTEWNSDYHGLGSGG